MRSLVANPDGRQTLVDFDRAAAAVVCRAVIRAAHLATRRALPRECCGLLGGFRAVGARPDRIVAAVPVRNIHPSCTRFELDPIESILAERVARAEGLDLLGYFHSHPTGAPHPSHADQVGRLWAGQGPDLHLIVSPARGWRLYRVLPSCWREVSRVSVVN